MSTSKTGKHGHAKVHLVGIDIFTQKKYEDLSPSTHNMDVPNVSRTEYQLVDIDDDFLNLMKPDGSNKDDVKVPEGELGDRIREAFESGEKTVSTWPLLLSLIPSAKMLTGLLVQTSLFSPPWARSRPSTSSLPTTKRRPLYISDDDDAPKPKIACGARASGRLHLGRKKRRRQHDERMDVCEDDSVRRVRVLLEPADGEDPDQSQHSTTKDIWL